MPVDWTHLQITALYAALNAIIALALAFNAGRMRGKTKILLGDGNNEQMLRAMRAHANNVEYVPLALVLLVLLALLHSSTYLLHGVGIALTIGRIVHGIGLSTNSGISAGRMIGSVLSIGAIVAEIIALLMAVLATG